MYVEDLKAAVIREDLGALTCLAMQKVTRAVIVGLELVTFHNKT